MQRFELFGVPGASARAEYDQPKDPVADRGCRCVEACCDAMNWCDEAYLRLANELAAERVGHVKVGALLRDSGSGEVRSAAAELVAYAVPVRGEPPVP